MYTFWTRSSPPAALATFDAPNREICTVRRARTNTPLQALVLMNDPTYVEAARALAQRMMTESGPGPRARIAFAFRLATGRRPNDAEHIALREVFEAQKGEYQADAEQALALLGGGQGCGGVEKPIGKGASAVVDVRDDAEITDALEIAHAPGPASPASGDSGDRR